MFSVDSVFPRPSCLTTVLNSRLLNFSLICRASARDTCEPRHTYHPSRNGLAEQFVQTLKSALQKASHGTSPSELADFLQAYRNTPHATTGEAPAMLLVGRRLRARLVLVRPSIEENLECPSKFDHYCVSVRNGGKQEQISSRFSKFV